MGSTLRAPGVAGSPSPQLCLVWVNPNLCGGGLAVCWVLPVCSPDPLSAPHHSARCPRTPSDMTASARFTFPLAPGWVWPVGNTSRRLEGGGEGHGALLPTTLQFAEAAPSLLGHDSTLVTPVCSCNTHQIQEAPPLSASCTKDSNDSPILANPGMLHHPIALPTHADLFIELLLCVPSWTCPPSPSQTLSDTRKAFPRKGSVSAPTQSVNLSKKHLQLKPPCRSRQAALFLIAIKGELFQIQVGDEERLRISTWKDIWGWAPFKANRALEQWRVLLWLVEAGMDYSYRHLLPASQPHSSNIDILEWDREWLQLKSGIWLGEKLTGCKRVGKAQVSSLISLSFSQRKRSKGEMFIFKASNIFLMFLYFLWQYLRLIALSCPIT